MDGSAEASERGEVGAERGAGDADAGLLHVAALGEIAPRGA